jgi:hypothetical protein
MPTTLPDQAPLITFIHLPSINFALQQNYVPVVRELSIANHSGEDWQQVKVEIVSEPEFAVVWQQTNEVLKSGDTWSLKQVSLNLSASFMAALSERMVGDLSLRVTVGDSIRFTAHYPIDLLAYDQWSGIGVMPEMLTAFVTPNHPEIPNVIRKASQVLAQWTGSPSFDEYQSRNPDRVRKQMAAIFEAIAELQPIYCAVPASFEESGQRVRLADSIFTNKLANCLDLSLLYAACLEAVGIHPFVVIIKGHAFTGAWLIDESFADAVNDDPSLLTKRMADGINEIVLVEATCMNAGQKASFDEAVHSAAQKMMQAEDFVLFLDVKRARFSGIRPLPLRTYSAGVWEIKEEQAERTNQLPEDIFVGPQLVYADKIELTKQRLWERKLLDLTLRNSLLNVRITKSVIQFMTIHIGLLEDALADGQEFQVLAKPADWDNTLRDTGLYKALHQTDPVADLLKQELAHKRIRTYLTESELQANLTNVYRSSRLALEENGANTLYIGLGMLKWFETNLSERPRYAPILLIPVEIIRKSAHKGYVIRSREEETIMNITLLEMLRQDFGIAIGGMDTLPRDENGVDVKAVLNIIRQAIMAQSRWDVEEQAILGTFSFSKFILWNDIHNNAEQLSKNKVVASLMSGKLEWDAQVQHNNAAIADGQLHPSAIALPISTDSSQLQAIVSSGQDKSFVLHGPPGTGKSQTITNIIANALYTGKRVLFVAAKKAALDVVENRLNAIGIAPFCLELHSNKAKKSSVLEQLKRATEVSQKSSSGQFQQEADRLFSLRNDLNTYVEALHKKYAFGYSLFDLFTAYAQLPQGRDCVSFPAKVFSTLTAVQLSQWQDLTEELQSVGLIIGHPKGHPLQLLQMPQYNLQMKQDAKQYLEQYGQQLKALQSVEAIVYKVLQLQDPKMDANKTAALLQLADLLLKLDNIPASFLNADPFEQTLNELIVFTNHGKIRDQIKNDLFANWQKDILSFPAEQTLSAWNAAQQKWFLPRYFQQKKLLKSLTALSLSGEVNKAAVPSVLGKIIEWKKEQNILDNTVHLRALLGFMWQNGACDWDAITAATEQIRQLNQVAGSIMDVKQMKGWRNAMGEEWAEGSKAYCDQYRKKINEYVALTHEVKATTTKLQELLGVDVAALPTNDKDRFANISSTIELWLQHLESFKDWYNWIHIRSRAAQEGLQPLIDSYESGNIESKDLLLQFNKGIFQSAANFIIAESSALSSFNGSLFDEKINKFRKISKAFESLTKEELYARLAAKIPNFTQEASQSSEIGMLQRIIRNNGRAMSIRKIFDNIPNLLPRLTPCMLMSPISVAQYFDANSIKFDLVIFDEASQMPTCEAISAIARGSNVIVVGDPKQMPPTNFFSTNNVDEDNIEKEDLESILDDCLALSMPSQHLLWHYRSKHESLIAFSNAKYYDNKLLTFPSTDDISSKVQFVPVEGFYDKGKTRQNHSEAKAIVAEVVHRLSHPDLSKRSIGIVTFSSVQQILIDDLLTEVFASRPDLEKIALESEEPIFIKNLENVQGDERDVILFSVGYGPDNDGKVSLNFGPINRDGGWRRLNVAVSRARYEMKVFSTLHADQIDLNRTNSEGVAGLKAFLAYAEKGKMALPVKHSDKHETITSFESVIADEIRKHGYEVHTHIGCSAYKIDIGVVDPEDASQYLLAILTDGKSYYNATTSKDREIVQVDVLKQLGWNVYKIWSTEWWEQPDKTIKGILEAIDVTKRNKLAQPIEMTAPAMQEEQVQVPEVAEEKMLPDPATQQPEMLLSHSEPTIQSAARPAINTVAIPYVVAQLEPVITASAEEFLLAQNKDKIKAQVLSVLETESPISKNLLCKRVLQSWNISRLGTRINNHFDLLFSQIKMNTTQYGDKTYFWKINQYAKSYSIFRMPSNDAYKRDADDLPPEEIANAIKEILHNQISLSQSDLIRETAKIFGYARIGANVEIAILTGIEYGISRTMAYRENDRIVLR